jgi:hypothetical protein
MLFFVIVKIGEIVTLNVQRTNVGYQMCIEGFLYLYELSII